MSDLAAFKKMKVQELRDACEEKGLDSTGLKAVLLERLEAWLAGSGAEAPAAAAAAAAAAADDEELEDIPDDDADAAADGDLVDPDADAADAEADASPAADADAAAADAEPAEPAKSDEELAAERAVVVAAVAGPARSTRSSLVFVWFVCSFAQTVDEID